jgi:hypothetical protein
MRRGRDGNNLERYLAEIGPVVLHTMASADVLEIARRLELKLPNGKYPAHQLERAVLAEGYTNWKWNARC